MSGGVSIDMARSMDQGGPSSGPDAAASDEATSAADSDSVTLGLIAPHGMALTVANKISRKLPGPLGRRVDPEKRWDITVQPDPLAGAGDALEVFGEAKTQARRQGWDLAVSLTDLPLYRSDGTPGRGRRVVVADVGHESGIAVISVPALGVLALRRKLSQAVLRLAGEWHTRSPHSAPADGESAEDKASATRGQLMQGWYARLTVPTRRLGSDRVEEGLSTRFVSPPARGHLRVLLGMVLANRPWSMFHNFRTVIAAAFATGAYGLIFPSVWHLSDAFSAWRLVLLMLLAMSMMVGWIAISHGLWEPIRGNQQLSMVGLYNAVTLTTLAMAVFVAYAALYAFLFGASVAFVPADHLQSILGHQVTFKTYGMLAWTAATIATVAGALGAGLEGEESVRQVAVSARQRRRLESAREDEADSDQQ